MYVSVNVWKENMCQESGWEAQKHLFDHWHPIPNPHGPNFRRAFKELSEELKISFTPSSPYNPLSNRLAEFYVQTKKLLFKKCIDQKEGFQSYLSALHHSVRFKGYSPLEHFYWCHPCTLLPDLTSDKYFEDDMKKSGKKHRKMRANMQKTCDRLTFNM